jgi:hypothetical protein
MDTQAEYDAVTAASDLPAAPATTTVNNYNCVRSLNAQPDMTLAVGLIKRVTLTCTHTSFAQQVFTLDLGRPL